MNLSAQEIAQRLNGEIVGNPETIVSSPARIENGKAGNICFFANPKYEQYIYTTKASIILVNKSFTPSHEVSATLIKVDDAYQAVAELLEYFQSKKKSKKSGNWFTRLFHPHRVGFKTTIGRGTFIGDYVTIGSKCKIGKNCQISNNVSIGNNVTIGDNVILYAGVRIYQECSIGNNCILHSNSVIGADGFGFAPQDDGTYRKIPQTGNVILEDDVEIGANTTVDRAMMGSTIVHKGVKIDNLCQIAHNVEIGENTVMAALSGIAGSSHIGKNCMFGGQSGIVGHIHIADHTTLAAHSAITKTVKKSGETLLGYPAFDSQQYFRAYVKFKQSGEE